MYRFKHTFLYFSAASGTPGTGPTHVSTAAPTPAPVVDPTRPIGTPVTPQMTIQADVHRVDILTPDEEDEDYDDVVEKEEGKDGEDLEHVAGEGMFQAIHCNVDCL